MYTGEYHYTLDEKGRLSIPAKMRQNKKAVFMVTRGLEKCLFVFNQKEWKIWEKKIFSLPTTKKEARSFSRFLLSGATECETNELGRINIPLTLRQYAGINKDAVIIGVGNRIEIWSKDNWASFLLVEEKNFAEAAENLVDLGI
ncbi:MAG: division/cell wall cluster transcriptional repressor MraZ [bacterium]|nr:division/cell wall cluster transcriptional repressor MraZ [bacterium]